jgi:hypothetical protein
MDLFSYCKFKDKSLIGYARNNILRNVKELSDLRRKKAVDIRKHFKYNS